MELVGVDAAHAVTDVRFENVAFDGRPLRREQIRANAAVRNVTVSP